METPEKSAASHEYPIHSMTSLGILLITFMGIFLGALFIIMTGKKPPEGFGREGYGPENFPKIFDREPVAGLASLSTQNHFSHITPEEEQHVTVARPPLSEDIFPCSNCHEGMETNEKFRVVEAHENIVLKHGDPKERWCLDCHNSKNRDSLHLANGKLVPFEESYRLCGQCHGNVYRDWKSGIHGKRVGFWNGPKIYLLCVHCHDPHSPHFNPISPLPPPVRPDYQRSNLKNYAPAVASGTKGEQG